LTDLLLLRHLTEQIGDFLLDRRLIERGCAEKACDDSADENGKSEEAKFHSGKSVLAGSDNHESDGFN
jgi:hypothetical protein